MKKELIIKLWFTLKDNSSWIYFKKYRDNTILEVDFEKQTFHFGWKIKIYDKEIQNITKLEDWVVFECVDRLLEKWYKSEDILLEKVYPTWRWTSWRLDILVMKEKKAFLMIECKTWWSEYQKEFKNMKNSEKGQLFTYFQQDRDTEFLVLYSSNFNWKEIEYKNEIVKIEDSYRETSNVEDLYNRWSKLTKDNWIFDNWVLPYNFESKALTYEKLNDIKESDASIIFNRFLEILRHNTVSDKPNAFNKMFTLFLCKIYDELDKQWTNKELEFQWIEWKDNNVSFQKKLTDLYKKWMDEFLKKQVTDFSDEDFEKQFWNLISDQKEKQKLLEHITKLRLQKNNEFAIKEVFDDESFEENAKVLKEIVELLQNYKFRYAKKQPFLWDFFELLLTTWLKQEAGQFFTPVPIARFICKSIPIEKIIDEKLNSWENHDILPSVIDYATWSWHFIIESMEEIQNIIKNKDVENYNSNIKKQFWIWKLDPYLWAKDYIYWIEKDYRLVRTSKVGCYLHWDWIATVIHWDWLDSFEKSNDYRWRLKVSNKDDKQENWQFDLVLSNPPYSVSAFKWNLKKDNAKDDFDLFDSLTDNSSEIEALFIERTKQLLKEWWIAWIILPSSILNNTWIYTKTREIILKNFEIISIVSLGSNTFMATWTNTVVLFMRKRNKFLANNLEKQINDLFKNLVDVSLNNIENVFSKYVNYVWEWLNFEDYKTLVLKNPNEKVLNHEIFKEYSKKIKLAKNEDLFEKIIEVEKDKMLYFVLSYNQKVVLVKSWEKQIEKEFLGYEFSFRKWSEWIHPIQWWKLIDECTKLFDPESLNNPEKASTYIYDWFNGNFTREISENLEEHIFRAKLVDLLTLDRVDFEKTISTNIKKKIRYEELWWIDNLKLLWEISDIKKWTSITLDKVKEWNIPVVAWWQSPAYYHNESNRNWNIITVSASWAYSWFINYFENPIFASDCNTIQSKNESIISTKLIFEFLKSIQSVIYWLQRWQAQPHVYWDDLALVKIPIPPKNIQEKIVLEIEILEKEEQEKKEKIEMSRNEIEKIIWWIKWESKKLSHLMNIVRGASPRPIREFQTNDENWVNWIKIWDVKPESKYITETKEKITLEWAKKSRFVNEWDFILSNSMSFWRPYIMKTSWCIHDGWLLMTDFFEWLDKNYLYSILTSDLVQKQFKWLASWWTSVDNLNIDKVNSVKIPLPPLETQKQIVSQIEKIENEIEILENDLKQIPEKKKEILKKYL